MSVCLLTNTFSGFFSISKSLTFTISYYDQYYEFNFTRTNTSMISYDIFFYIKLYVFLNYFVSHLSLFLISERTDSSNFLYIFFFLFLFVIYMNDMITRVTGTKSFYNNCSLNIDEYTEF